MNARDLTLGLMPYGTVYLIDQDLSRDEQRRDLENIRRLGFNTVVLWPAMSRWDADMPGGVAFDSVDAVMDMCAELGLKAILELQGQNPSFQEAPEAIGLPDGLPAVNPRDTGINLPEYRELTCRYIREVAAHFRGHPALLAYDIYNEVGNISCDRWTVAEFIEFVKSQYGGDIRALNRAWGCFFGDFEGISRVPPNFNAWRWSSPVAQRDWLRFRTHNFVTRTDEWAAAVRDVDPDVIVFGDVLGCDTMHNRAIDYYGVTDWAFARHVQVLGLSCYGNMLGRRWWEVDAWRWAHWWRSAHSAAQGKQTLISEMMTQNRTMFSWDASSMTDQVRLWSYQAIFHGIKGLIYWKFRPFRKGLQVAGRGLTDFAGCPNQFGEQAAEVAAFVGRHADELAGLRPDAAGCAILHDHNTQDVYDALQPKLSDFYTDAHGGIFRGFWDQGISPLFVAGEDVAAGGVPDWVRVLAVPCDVAVSQAVADALVTFMRRGGALLTEGRFALLDQDATLWPHVPGGGLSEVVGVEELNFTARYCDSLRVGKTTLTFDNDYCQELALDREVEALMTSQSGRPLAVARDVGKGLYVHVPLLLGQMIHEQRDGAREVFARLFKRLQPFTVPVVPVIKKDRLVDVSLLLGEDGQLRVVGVVNYEESPTRVRLACKLEPRCVEGDAKAAADVDGDELVISVSARRAAAVFL
ncbi:MAG: beta-galactosidase [Planctomycetes bacterium]|nr:beta-galactosidase [Planctomycetota bacterium]